jgi:hypothetical protein
MMPEGVMYACQLLVLQPVLLRLLLLWLVSAAPLGLPSPLDARRDRLLPFLLSFGCL